MISVPTISPNDIFTTLDTNQITEISLKDGTILKITQSSNQSNQQNLMKSGISLINKKNIIKKKQQEKYDNKVHNHHNDGFGAFGQHFKTEYSQVCGDCAENPGGIIKQRKNYILYVSKNITDENVSKKYKNQNNYQIYQQMPNQENIELNQQNQKVISQGRVECNDMPILEPKAKLRNEQNIMLCPECSENENNNLCPECANEQEENINEEKVTTTEKVLVPENENNFQ